MSQDELHPIKVGDTVRLNEKYKEVVEASGYSSAPDMDSEWEVIEWTTLPVYRLRDKNGRTRYFHYSYLEKAS